MHRLLIATVVAILAAGTLAMPTEAATRKDRVDGWHVFASNQFSASTTLIDRSPARTFVWVAIQKKPGPQMCRANVAFTRGHRTSSRSFKKQYTRTGWRSGVWTLAGRRDRTIGVRITTNGRCIVAAGVR